MFTRVVTSAMLVSPSPLMSLFSLLLLDITSVTSAVTSAMLTSPSPFTSPSLGSVSLSLIKKNVFHSLAF